MAGTVIKSAVGHRPAGIRRTNLALATASTADGGDIAATVVEVGYGRLVAFYDNAGGDASAVVTVKDNATGATLFTHTTGTEGTPVSKRPTAVIATNAGAAIGAAAEAPNVNRDIYVAGKVLIDVANMGVSEAAIMSIVIDETDTPSEAANV